MIMINTANLDDEINKLKSELIEASQENDDLVAESVVEKSQELDKLIVAFMDKQLQGWDIFYTKCENIKKHVLNKINWTV